VKGAKDRIEHDNVTDIITTLTKQQQRVLAAIIVKKWGEATSSEVYEAYEEASQGDSVSYRRMFDYVKELELLGLISTRTVPDGRGRTTIIKLRRDPSMLEKALFGKEVLSESGYRDVEEMLKEAVKKLS